jgi:hypothetical protein
MKPTSTLTTLLAAATVPLARAVVLNIYSDDNCQDQVGNVNVWDHTCATMGDNGFSSFQITETTPTYGLQLTTYTRDACAGWWTRPCVDPWDEKNVGVCYKAINEHGASHALSSGDYCGVV